MSRSSRRPRPGCGWLGGWVLGCWGVQGGVRGWARCRRQVGDGVSPGEQGLMGKGPPRCWLEALEVGGGGGLERRGSVSGRSPRVPQ